MSGSDGRPIPTTSTAKVGLLRLLFALVFE